MIIPKEFQFTSREDAETKMKAYIKQHFSGLLGPKVNLIDQANGLELIAAETKARMEKQGMAVGRSVRAA